MPAHRAVAQRHHLVRQAGVDQRLRADDAAGAAGAIDHHQRVGRRRDVADAQHQLGARHVGGARDRDALEFVERAAVDHHHVGAAAHQAVELLGGNARRVAGVLDVLAERLARHVDAGEQLEAGLLPGGDAALQIQTCRCSRRRRESLPRARPGRRRRRTARCGCRGAAPAARSAAPAGSAAPSAPTADDCARRSAPRADRSAPARRRRTSMALTACGSSGLGVVRCHHEPHPRHAPGLSRRIHACFGTSAHPRRGWPGQARP